MSTKQCTATHWFSCDPDGVHSGCVLDAGHGQEHEDRQGRWWGSYTAPAKQPMPTPNESTPIVDLVLADLRERDRLGRQRYGTPLQAHNGRDSLRDAYEEALDLSIYLRQHMEERHALATERDALAAKLEEVTKQRDDAEQIAAADAIARAERAERERDEALQSWANAANERDEARARDLTAEEVEALRELADNVRVFFVENERADVALSVLDKLTKETP